MEINPGWPVYDDDHQHQPGIYQVVLLLQSTLALDEIEIVLSVQSTLALDEIVMWVAT